MKFYSFTGSFLSIVLLLGNFSCSPTKLGKKTMSKLRSGGDYITEQTKVAYRSSRDALGLKEEVPPPSSKPMTVSKRVFGQLYRWLKSS